MSPRSRADNVRRQTALAAADAYLTILARRRLVEGNIRARDTAREHFDLAREFEAQGAGSRLNMLRAQQELSADEVLRRSRTAVALPGAGGAWRAARCGGSGRRDRRTCLRAAARHAT